MFKETINLFQTLHLQNLTFIPVVYSKRSYGNDLQHYRLNTLHTSLSCDNETSKLKL